MESKVGYIPLASSVSLLSIGGRGTTPIAANPRASYHQPPVLKEKVQQGKMMPYLNAAAGVSVKTGVHKPSVQSNTRQLAN